MAKAGEHRREAGQGTPPRWRLSVFHLVGLAAGGVVGSGWISSASNMYGKVGANAWLVWIVGGLLMFVIAWVMVELGRESPRTGGLIFHPLRSSGPLVASVVAAGLWIFYAINLASESISMTNGFVGRSHLFRNVKSSLPSNALTAEGWLTVVVFMMLISALTLLLPRVFFGVNSWITVLKIVIIASAAVVLLWHSPDAPHHAAGRAVHGVAAGHADWNAILTSVVSGGVIYTYVGFQGPLDFAGDIRRSPMRRRAAVLRRPADRGADPEPDRAWEASRLSRAVLGTVIGSLLLYVALQVALSRHHGDITSPLLPPFVQIAQHEHIGPLVGALRVGGVLAPMGAGLVFAYALTREVAALGRAHLTHRGLQTARTTTIGRHHGIYWLILVVNLVLAVVILVLVRGNWKTLISISGVLALIVYAMPSVALVAGADGFTQASGRRRAVRDVLARTSFVLIGLILYMTGWTGLWYSMVALVAGSAVLLGLPLVPQRWPGFARFYDAKAHARLFRENRRDPAVRAVLVLLGYLAALLLLALWSRLSSVDSLRERIVPGVLTTAVALAAFELLVRVSKEYMAAADSPDGPPKEPATAAP